MSLATIGRAAMVTSRGVVACGGADALDRIGAPGTALAIWERRLPGSLVAALAALDLDGVDDIDGEVGADTPFAGLLHDAGYAGASADALAADIGALARRHGALTGAERLAMRLQVIETDACRRFHADYVTLRLLCTYVGPGTEWHRADAPDAIAQVATGDVAVFKGRSLLDPPAVLHRSPPIVATGGRRLMLVLDRCRPDE